MKLPANTGPADRIVRLVLGGSLVAFAALGLFPAGSRFAVAVVAAVVTLTGATGYCPVYALLRLSSRPNPSPGTPVRPAGSDGLNDRS